ncbi:ABC transporter [Actinomyces sp. oral taxon 414]|uniref:ABC transporter ATP-binding protein n=1 Tax=Actinomyces sp. oral taxon 414 TaxID=712122 RepID=UPI0006AFEA98|nr:ABC transporter ATP-binding protein [Actinomyces sp. oral taxon 414]ALD00512.1 ABC transporter [Actinomyces sp. oral taxon 414]
MIRFERASFAYRSGAAAGETGEAGVRDVDLQVRPGEVVVLCGRSGCGKSTLLRLANGLAPRFFPGHGSGRVLLDGEEVGDLATWRIAERAGSLFQNPRTQFFNVDTTGEVAFALESAGWPEGDIRARVDSTLRELGLEHLAGRSVFELSGGQRQKIAYASIWALRPPNLLLDEPTSNLDAPAIADIAAFVADAKAAGRAVLVAEHRLAWLSGIADAYVHLDGGRISRVMDAREFAALDPRELDSMGLRTRDLGSVAPPAGTSAPDGGGVGGDGGGGVVLSARGLSVDYGRGPVVAGVDVDLRAGEVVALVGRNGSGKTTLCRALCGLGRRARGEILLDGRRATRRRRTRSCSMVFQNVDYQLFAESAAAEVTFGLPRRAADAVDTGAVLRELALDGVADRHPATLSGGQKQRLAVAACVAAGKRVLVFDEPTSGIDLDGMRRVARLLRRLAARGRAVLVITHDLELIACACDRVLHMDGGRVVGRAGVREDFDAVRAMTTGAPAPGREGEKLRRSS